MPRFKYLLAGAAFSLLFLLLPTQGGAALILKVQESGFPAKVIYDDVSVPPPGTDPDGQPAAPGTVVFFSFSYGNYSQIVAIGVSKPALGTAAFPHLTLNTSANSGPGAGTLTLTLTDTDFAPVPPYFISNTGGFTNSSVQVSTYVDFTNTEFGIGTPLSSLGPFAPPVFSKNEEVIKSGTTPYSLTIVTKITPSGALQSTQAVSEILTGDVVETPEPTTWALAGLGFVGLTAWGWRRHRRRAA